MKYKHITSEDQDDIIAQAIIQREKEHHNYEVNRLNYIHILDQMKDLPVAWPENLKPFRTLGGEQLADALKGEELVLASRLQFRDRVQVLLTTTTIEQSKVESVHMALHAVLPEGPDHDAAIERVKSASAGKK